MKHGAHRVRASESISRITCAPLTSYHLLALALSLLYSLILRISRLLFPVGRRSLSSLLLLLVQEFSSQTVLSPGELYASRYQDGSRGQCWYQSFGSRVSHPLTMVCWVWLLHQMESDDLAKDDTERAACAAHPLIGLP